LTASATIVSPLSSPAAKLPCPREHGLRAAASLLTWTDIVALN